MAAVLDPTVEPSQGGGAPPWGAVPPHRGKRGGVWVPHPVFQLWTEDLYGKGPQGDQVNIAPFITQVTYSDKAHGESDELRLEVDDFDGLFRGEWIPQKGQGITLAIGYEGEAMEPRGRFEVDEVEFSGPPDVLTIKALNAAVKKTLRQSNHKAYEGTTLLEVARQVAHRHGFEVIHEGAEGMSRIKLARVTQNGERDLSFLKRLAEPYGYVFKVTDKHLVFTSLRALESQAPILHFDKTQLSSWRFTDGTKETWKKAEVRYHDPATGRIRKGQAGDEAAVKVDSLKLNARVESDAQAQAMAEESLRRANGRGKTGSITLPGNIRVLSGVTLELTGLLMLSGTYLVESSTHKLTRSAGYVTDAEVKRV